MLWLCTLSVIMSILIHVLLHFMSYGWQCHVTKCFMLIDFSLGRSEIVWVLLTPKSLRTQLRFASSKLAAVGKDPGRQLQSMEPAGRFALGTPAAVLLLPVHIRQENCCWFGEGKQNTTNQLIASLQRMVHSLGVVCERSRGSKFYHARQTVCAKGG